ncbi:MAG: cell division protein FtsA [Bacteroidales bacterium]|nr:cell division protein FtsA [Bacteroidales bacterium]
MGTSEFIVAFEFGSFKLTGVVGRRNLEGTIEVLGMEQRDSRECVKKGVIYNIDKTAKIIRNIVDCFNVKFNIKITGAYVGVGGFSLHSVLRNDTYTLEDETKITQNDIDIMMDANGMNPYPNYKIYAVVPQGYKVGEQTLIDPIGVKASSFEGTFLNILARKNNLNNIVDCFNSAGLILVDAMVAPMAEANHLLTNNEKRMGCALVNIGYETTTVSVYKNNLLRHCVVIPLGSNNMTRDICSQQIEWDDAEKLKRNYGVAYNNYDDVEEEKKYVTTSNGQPVTIGWIRNVVIARCNEILDNVYHQIVLSQYSSTLLAGVVVTGNGSLLKGMEEAFEKHLNFSHCRIVPSESCSGMLHGLLEFGQSGCVASIPQKNELEENVVTEENVNSTEEFVKPETTEPTPEEQQHQRTIEQCRQLIYEAGKQKDRKKFKVAIKILKMAKQLAVPECDKEIEQMSTEISAARNGTPTLFDNFIDKWRQLTEEE